VRGTCQTSLQWLSDQSSVAPSEYPLYVLVSGNGVALIDQHMYRFSHVECSRAGAPRDVDLGIILTGHAVQRRILETVRLTRSLKLLPHNLVSRTSTPPAIRDPGLSGTRHA
jgi:hypothetical protein